MAWTAVPTTKVGTMYDAVALNARLRDNLKALDGHAHDGGSGSGTRSLGGSATGFTVLYFADGAAPAAPTGTITVLFTSGSMLGHRSSGGAALMLTSTAHTHGY